METTQPANRSFKTYLKKLYPFILIFIEIPIWTYNTIPCPITPEELSIPPTRVPFGEVSVLSQVEKLYQGKVGGTHFLVVDKEHIYTGTQDGYVNDLWNGTVRRLVRFGMGTCGPAIDFQQEETCGRPMGMRIDRDGSLLVVDAYNGLFRVNKNNGSYSRLYENSTPVNGLASRCLTDLVTGPDGKIYFLDFSTKFPKHHMNHQILEMSPSGRLLMYEPGLDTTVQIVDNIVSPVGLQLDKNQTGLLITSALLHGIYRFDLTSKLLIVWVDGLPGSPSGIRYSSTTDSYWLALNFPRSPEKPNLLEKLAASSFFFRRFCAKVFSMDLLEVLSSQLGWYRESLIGELALDGSIRRILREASGQIDSQLQEVQNIENVLYITGGAFHTNTDFIGRVRLNAM